MSDWVDDFEDVIHVFGALAGLYCILMFYNGTVKGFEGVAVGVAGIYSIIIALKEHFEHASLH